MAIRRKSRKSASFPEEPVTPESEDSSSFEDAAPESVPEEQPAPPPPAPEPVPEKKAAPPPPAPEPKKPTLQAVPLRVFLAANKAKPDQMAGFESWAKRNKLGPRPILEWRAEVQKFNSTPVK